MAHKVYLLADLRAISTQRIFTGITEEKLRIAGHPSAIAIADARLSAVATARDDLSALRAIHRHAQSFIKDVTLALITLSLYRIILPVGHDPSVELIHF